MGDEAQDSTNDTQDPAVDTEDSTGGAPDLAAGSADPTTDHEAELARLQAENDALRSELDNKAQQKSSEGARRWTSIILAVLAGVLVPLAALTVWVERTALDTDQYVDTVGPLASDEAVQNRVATVVSAEINEQVDFEALLTEQIEESDLPEGLNVLVAPLAGGAEAIVERVVTEIVQSEAFASLWEAANEAGHSTVVAVLKGEGDDVLATDDGRIRLTFGSLLDDVGAQLEERFGTDFVARLGLDDVDAEVVLLESEELASAQGLVSVLDTLSWLVPLLAVALLVLVVVVARDRRLGARRAGLAVLIPSLLVLGALAVVRSRVVSEAEDEEAARAVVDQLLTFLLREFRALVVLGVVILLAAWLFGPSRSGTKARAWIDSLLGRASAVDDPTSVGAFPVWVARSRAGLLGGILVLAGVALVLADRPTGWTILLIALVAGALMLLVEGLARVGRQAVTAAPEPSAT